MNDSTPSTHRSGVLPLPRSTLALAAAIAVSCASLSSALAFARVLERQAARTSHEQPTVDHWFEPITPTSPALVTHGRKLFLDSCAHCHGADATGDEGPDLHDVEVSDRYISNIITHGIKGEMPSFRKKLGKDEITSLTAYVRSLD